MMQDQAPGCGEPGQVLADTGSGWLWRGHYIYIDTGCNIILYIKHVYHRCNYNYHIYQYSTYILAGGFKHGFYVAFHIWDGFLPIDFHIFQRGWNHQPVYIYIYILILPIIMARITQDRFRVGEFIPLLEPRQQSQKAEGTKQKKEKTNIYIYIYTEKRLVFARYLGI